MLQFRHAQVFKTCQSLLVAGGSSLFKGRSVAAFAYGVVHILDCHGLCFFLTALTCTQGTKQEPSPWMCKLDFRLQALAWSAEDGGCLIMPKPSLALNTHKQAQGARAQKEAKDRAAGNVFVNESGVFFCLVVLPFGLCSSSRQYPPFISVPLRL